MNALTIVLGILAGQSVNQPPTASFTVSPTSGGPPLAVAVNGAGSSDPDGTIVSYAWTWDDGSAASSGVTAGHGYPSPGTYRIRLTVTDDRGATGTTFADVDCISPSNLPPFVIASATPTLGEAPLDVTFGSIVHDDAGPHTHRWDPGDGSPPVTLGNVANHGGSTVAHTYLAPGTYAAVLRVYDPDSIWREHSVTVTVVAARGGDRSGGRCGATGAEGAIAFLFLLLHHRIRRSRISPVRVARPDATSTQG